MTAFNVNMFDYNMTETSAIRLIIFMSTYLTQVTKFVRLEIFWVSAVVCLWSDFYWQVLYEHTKKPRLKAPKYWPLPPPDDRNG